MFLGINSIFTPVYLPLCEYGQNQPPWADVGLLLNMAWTCLFHSLIWAILRSNPPSSNALGVYFPIYTPRSIYSRSVYLIVVGWSYCLLSNFRGWVGASAMVSESITKFSNFNLFRQSNLHHVANISGATMLKESLLSDTFALGNKT